MDPYYNEYFNSNLNLSQSQSNEAQATNSTPFMLLPQHEQQQQQQPQFQQGLELQSIINNNAQCPQLAVMSQITQQQQVRRKILFSIAEIWV
jgi:hypothetical protein